MKTTKTTLKAFTIALLAGLGLSGCVAVPVYDGGPRAYGPPVYAPPTVVLQPVIGFGFGYGYGGHGYYGGHGHW